LESNSSFNGGDPSDKYLSKKQIIIQLGITEIYSQIATYIITSILSSLVSFEFLFKNWLFKLGFSINANLSKPNTLTLFVGSNDGNSKSISPSSSVIFNE
jgi:hypothetical protein